MTVEFILEQVIKWLIPALLGGLAVALKVEWAQVKALRDGMRCVLRSQIIAIYNRSTERGYCPIYERENLTHAEEAYLNLKGNGVVPGLCQKTLALPTEPSEDSE